MRAHYDRKYRETHREEINAYRRSWRLKRRKAKLKGKHCLNCGILLAERLEDKGRSYLYCRKCLTEYRAEARRHRWKRYYQRKKQPVKVANGNVISWRTLKQQKA